MSASGIALRPLAWLYALVIASRNWLYEHGMLARHSLAVPVLSVGNLTAGGTGKTPMVSFLVDWAESAGVRPAIVGRGYRRKSKGTVVVSDGRNVLASPAEAGDELSLLARRHPRAVVIADERRPRGASRAVSDFGAQVVILDDGFQHRALARDLDIVMIDATTPLPDIGMLPSGLRREPLGALRRASVLVFSNAPDAYDDRWVGRYSGAPRARVRYTPLGVRRLHERSLRPVAEFAGRRCVAFCGIGNPDAFRLTAAEAGLDIRALQAFRDHVWYTDQELRQLQAALASSGADLLLTTEKDAAKLESAGWPDMPLYVLAVGLEFLSGRHALEAELRKVVARRTV